MADGEPAEVTVIAWADGSIISEPNKTFLGEDSLGTVGFEMCFSSKEELLQELSVNDQFRTKHEHLRPANK